MNKHKNPKSLHTSRVTPEQKQDRVLTAVNNATFSEPLTLRGVSAMSGLTSDEVRFYCNKLADSKQINVIMIPDPFYPQQKIRAFYKKY